MTVTISYPLPQGRGASSYLYSQAAGLSYFVTEYREERTPWNDLRLSGDYWTMAFLLSHIRDKRKKKAGGAKVWNCVSLRAGAASFLAKVSSDSDACSGRLKSACVCLQRACVCV